MNFKALDKQYWRNLLTRTMLVVLTILLIVWFLPRNEEPHFRYDINKPWMYGSFIAKFDFPIYKTEEAIKAQQDSILKTFQPYYNYDIKIETEQLNKLRNDFKEGFPGLPKEYVSQVISRLHRLYQAGIMSAPEYGTLSKDSCSTIRVVSGKEAQSLEVKFAYSTLTAYNMLFDDERLAPMRLALQKFNLNEYIEPNLLYDKERSETELNDLLSGISPASGMVLSGQKIIDRGEIVDEYTYRVLSSFERELQRRSAASTEITSTIIGQLLYVGIMVLLFSFYLWLFRRDYFDKPRSITMLYAMITMFPIIVSVMMSHNFFSIYILPFAMVPIFARVFMDSRTAFITHVTTVLICAAAVKYQYEFIIVQIVAGLVAIYSLRELSQRAQVIKTALFATLASSAIYFALQLIQSNDITKLDHSIYTYFAMNGVLLLLAYPLMYLIEKLFGFTSNVTLFELSNTNSGVIRDQSEIAPGTFQHSITEGNLAAEIANRIRANSLLVRTGALYHDIGKMVNPVFFTENQAGVNPHDALTSAESARIIIGHVKEGVKIAEKKNLPTVINNFIITHHGLGLVKYYYVKEQNAHPDEPLDKAAFMYPGPNPFTREQAILMMSDTVEAASRSLSDYTEESISNLVNKLIDSQVTEGYYKECPITFRDIDQSKQVLIERLTSIYHTRIQYPELKKRNESEKEPSRKKHYHLK